jgi:hypothetical protein
MHRMRKETYISPCSLRPPHLCGNILLGNSFEVWPAVGVMENVFCTARSVGRAPGYARLCLLIGLLELHYVRSLKISEGRLRYGKLGG